MKKKHCWHASGLTISNTFGGEAEFICCQCGTPWTRKYEDRQQKVSGHGPYYSETVQIWEAEPEFAEWRCEPD